MINPVCLGMTELPKVIRRMLHLHVEFGLTVPELAEVFETPQAAVRKKLLLAKRRYDETYKKVRW